MKFLCVPCDQPMKLMATKPPERGSLTVVYGCPSCGYEMAMLTNPHETQMVTSLGVRIGKEAGSATTGNAMAADSESGEKSSGAGCPFAAIVSGFPESARDATGAASVRWTPIALARLENIPSFVRPMARAGIEKFAADRGLSEVNERVLDEAREHFGM